MQVYVIAISKFLGFRKKKILEVIEKYALDNDFYFEKPIIKKDYLLRSNDVQNKVQNMQISKEIRKEFGDDILALKAASDALGQITNALNSNKSKVLVVINSLKTKAELEILKKLFGESLITIAAYCSDDVVLEFLRRKYPTLTQDEMNELVPKEKKTQNKLKKHAYDAIVFNDGNQDQLPNIIPVLEAKTKNESFDLVEIQNKMSQIDIQQKIERFNNFLGQNTMSNVRVD